MNKVLLYSFALLSLVLTSCGKSDKELVQETGEKFISAIISGDLATAKNMVTPATYEKWGNTAGFLDAVMPGELKDALKSVQSVVGNVQVTGNEAQATLVAGIPSLVGEVTVLHFKKEGDKWLINEPGILVREVISAETQVIDTVNLEVEDDTDTIDIQ